MSFFTWYTHTHEILATKLLFTSTTHTSPSVRFHSMCDPYLLLLSILPIYVCMTFYLSYCLNHFACIVALKYRIQSRETHSIGSNWTWIAINLRWSSNWGNGFFSLLSHTHLFLSSFIISYTDNVPFFISFFLCRFCVLFLLPLNRTTVFFSVAFVT